MINIKKPRSVFLYWPNIIDYIRVIAFIIGLNIAKQNPMLGVILFTIAGLLDAIDGAVARKFNQESNLGVIMDYAIDRIIVAGFYIGITTLYPAYWIVFFLLLSLDMGSHLFYLNVTRLEGKASHKLTQVTDPWLLRLYYKPKVLFATCLLHDYFFGALFFAHLYPMSPILILFFVITVPAFAFKTLVHVVTLIHAAQRTVNIDNLEIYNKNIKN